MDRNRWKQIDEVLDAVLKLEPHERAPFLDQVCAGDEEDEEDHGAEGQDDLCDEVQLGTGDGQFVDGRVVVGEVSLGMRCWLARHCSTE